jgi:3-oxoacyl-[acyl-carrier protein] reductase
MKSDLNGKLALVTGGGRGIGRAIAERLGSMGALVAINYSTNANAAEQVVDAIKTSGGQAFAIAADIGDSNATAGLFRELDLQLKRHQATPHLDILVNNAGIGSFGDVEHTSIEDFDAVFRTNVRGTFLATKEALTRLRPEGRIVNISSAAVRHSESALAAYTMSKAAIQSLTVMLARDLGPRHITVNAVAPGWVETDINIEARKDATLVDQVQRDTALGRFGRPADIADIVAFLISPSAGWVTGQVIETSGGYRL